MRLKEAAVKFIDNGGGLMENQVKMEPQELPCDYCEGERSPNLLQIILTKQLFLYKVIEVLSMVRTLKFKTSC